MIVCIRPHLVLKVAPAAFIRILSVIPDEQTLDPIVIYHPYEGGHDTILPFSEFVAKFPNAELGLPEIQRGQVYQVAGGVRKKVLAVTFNQAVHDLMLGLRSDDGSVDEEIAASAFLARNPELVAC